MADETVRPRNVTARTLALPVLMFLALTAALQAARALFVPVIIGVLLSYMLEPMVSALVVRGSSRTLAATIVFVGMLATVGAGTFGLRHQAVALIDRLPGAAQQLRFAIEKRTGGKPTAMTQVQRAADEIRQLSAETAGAKQKPTAPPPVENRPFQIADYLWSGSLTVTGFVGDSIIVLFLAYYLLLAGDLFRRRLMEIAGPTLSRKKVTLQILDAISVQIGRYLFVRAVISAMVAAGTSAALWALGLAQPGLWGVVAGVLNIVPYVGSAAVMIAAALAAFLQFETFTMAALAAGAVLAVACLEAYLLTPWLTSRAADMNPAVVFIGLVFWGWLWGLPGLLLAVPLLMVMKSVSDHIEALQPVAIMLRK
jgi:predicted PurR-regulated permease PerM